MRPTISISVAFVTALLLLFVVSSSAQVNGTPASVTSPGFGGNAINGPRASVTSLGPQGYAPAPGPPFITGNGVRHGTSERDGHHRDGNRDHDRDGRRHNNNSDFVGPIWYAVPVPYAVEGAQAEDQPEAAEDEADYQGGPTVFDRRGPGERSYVPPAKQAAPAHAPERATEAPAAELEPPLPSTLLVFKDGRTVEVGNYAIQGPMLYDLTPGHRRKILIADLDLDATRKQNDERGVMFQLPLSIKAN